MSCSTHGVPAFYLRPAIADEGASLGDHHLRCAAEVDRHLRAEGDIYWECLSYDHIHQVSRRIAGT